MKIRKQSYCKDDDVTYYLIYEETVDADDLITTDVFKQALPNFHSQSEDYKKAMRKTLQESGKQLYGAAYDKQHLCSVNIHGPFSKTPDRIEYEFENLVYSEDELDLIQKKGKDAAKRLKKKREQNNKDAHPTLFDMKEA